MLRVIYTRVWLLLVLVAPSWIDQPVMAVAGPCPATGEAVSGGTTSPTQPIAYGHHLLWKIRHADDEPSYLFGTVHLSDITPDDLPAAVDRALAQAERFLMEVVMDPAARRVYARSLYLPKGRHLTEMIDDPALFERMTAITRDHYHIDASRLDRFKPWAAFTILSRPPRGRRHGKGPVLDEQLRQRAEHRGMPVSGLETARELAAALEAIPRATQLKLLREAVCHYPDLGREWNRLRMLYLEQDVAGILALNGGPRPDDQPARALMRHVVYRRNARMVARMQPRLRDGGAFIAVGALHLPGERGILQRLKQRGYQVSPVE